MSTGARIRNVITGLFVILGSFLMMLFPDFGYLLAMAILSLMLLSTGIRYLFYYFSMARHMVGGKQILFLAIIILDLGMFTLSLAEIPRFFVLLYLRIIYIASGLIRLLRGLEARKQKSPSWKYTVANGVIDLILGLLTIVFSADTTLVLVIFCLGLLHSGITRIVNAFRRTAIVYIQ